MSTNTGLTIPFTGLRKQYNDLRNEILSATDEVLRSGQLMNGNNTVEFEAWLAKKNKVKYAVTCHSGTHALEIIAEFYATDVSVPNPPTVVLPTLTYAATANAFARAGWQIVFVDTDKYGIINFDRIPDIDYQAIVLVGLYGASVVDTGPRNFKKSVNYFVNTITIEDAAQHWLSAGCTRFGCASAVSFDPMKNLACYGNGGAVLTNELDLAEFARSWRDNGKPNHYHTGTNSRMSEIDAATMLIKTRHIDAWQQRRAKIAQYWVSRLENTVARTLIDSKNIKDHAFHKFVIDVNDRDTLQKKLTERKIETKIHYAQPLHEIGTFRQWPGPDMLSSATALSRRVLSLPLYPELTDLQVEYIIDTVVDCIN
jgi:dTDP-4-amino-4,6-dideoxygalactose transaminase